MKRFFTLFLALTLALSCLFIAPLSVNAATDKPFQVLKSDNTVVGTYATLSEALDGGLVPGYTDFTIRLLDDVTITAAQNLNCFKAADYTIDGNGFTITQTTDKVSALTLYGAKGYTATLKNVKINSAGACVTVNCGTVNFIEGSYTTTTPTDAGYGISTIYLETIQKYGDTSKYDGIVANFISGSYYRVGPDNIATVYANNNWETGVVANFYGGYYHANVANQTIYIFNHAVGNIYGGTYVNTKSGAYFTATVTHSGSTNVITTMNVYGGNFVAPNATNSLICNNHASSVLNIVGGNFFGGTGFYKTKVHNQTYANSGTGILATNSNSFNASSPLPAGYSARLTEGTSGLRFTSTISKAVIDRVTALADAGTTLSYGTLIAPTASISAGAFTIDALNVAGKVAGTDYVDVAANEGLTFDAAGNAKINAAIIKIKTANYTKSFSAIAYIKATINGQTVYFYGAYDEAKNQSSIANVATLALADVKEAAEGNYTNLVSDGSAQNGKYSPYTAAQRAVLAAYLAAAN